MQEMESREIYEFEKMENEKLVDGVLGIDGKNPPWSYSNTYLLHRHR